MPQDQQYVSNELFHFVGRNQQPKRQFELLVQIMQSRVLLSSKCAGTNYDLDGDGRLLAGEMMNVPAICFCDIPVESLSIHIKKYGPFSLSFSKRFVSNNGGKPVIYVPLKSMASIGQGSRGSDLPQKLRTVIQSLRELEKIRSNADYNESINDRQTRRLVSKTIAQGQFLTKEFYYFIKLFDEDLPLEHRKNYYMEREWRIVNNPIQPQLQFSISNIKHIIVPGEFRGQILRMFPNVESKLINAPK